MKGKIVTSFSRGTFYSHVVDRQGLWLSFCLGFGESPRASIEDLRRELLKQADQMISERELEIEILREALGWARDGA